MSDPKYLFIGLVSDKGFPPKIVKRDHFVLEGRLKVYSAISLYRDFELYLIAEQCDAAVWRQYYEDHAEVITTDKELAEYQRLKAEFEGE